MIGSRARPKRPRGLRGQAMVEFAFTFPLFIILLIALIEGGRYLFYSEVLNHAAREGARYQVIHGSNSDDPTGPPDGNDIKDAVVATAGALGGQVDPNRIALEWNPPNNQRGSTITVTVEYVYSPIVPVFGPLTITSESSLVINN